MRARQLSAVRPSSGFSLLEMLLVMALIAIATLLWADLGNRFVWFALIVTLPDRDAA